MPTLKVVTLPEVYDQVKRGAGKAIAASVFGKKWRLVTLVHEDDPELSKSKFFKSISTDINADDKKATCVQLLSAIGSASNVENYYDFFNGNGVDCKEAHAFNYQSQRLKVLELKKQRKKERIYFFPLVINDARFFVLLLAHHKRDETTPKSVAGYCETQITALLNNRSTLKVLE